MQPLASPLCTPGTPYYQSWHKVPREQVLYIFQLYNGAADSFN